MRKKLLLQLFGMQDEPNNDEPTKEVENEETTTEFEGSEEEPSTEDDKSKEDEAKAEVEKQKELSRQAYLRRQQEKEAKKLRQQQEAEKHNSYIEGLKKSTNGINPFTNQPIVDEEDIAEYEAMLELQNKGKDPIEDYAAYVKEKRRAERLEAEKVRKAQEESNNELEKNFNEFVGAYGLDTAQKVLNDKKFLDFGKDLIDSGAPLKLVYEKYMLFEKQAEKRADDLLIQKQARQHSSPGANGAGDKVPNTIANMSDEEFDNYYNQLLHG